MKNKCPIIDVPRRSLRRATIERRVWSDSYKDKNIKLINKLNVSRKKTQVVYKRLTKSSANKHNNAITFIRKSKFVRGIRNNVHRKTIKNSSGEQKSLTENINCVTGDSEKNKSYFINTNLKVSEFLQDKKIDNNLQLTNSKEFMNFHNVKQYIKNQDSKDINKLLNHLEPRISKNIENEDDGPGINKSLLSPEIDGIDKEYEYRNSENNFESKSNPSNGYCDQDCKEIKSFIISCEQACGNSPVQKNISNECLIDNELSCADDDHVSLSEALAKLVDSDESGQGIESETVTIHPVINSDANHVTELSQKSEEEEKANHEVTSTVPVYISDSTELFLPQKESFNSELKCEETINPGLTNKEGCSKSEIDECGKYFSKGAELISSVVDDNLLENIFTCGSSFIEKTAVPNFIKVPNKTPVVKTPLKCSECPMRFCTVRSLLWHFGTHEPKSKERKCSSVLLENLIAPWGNPHLQVTKDEVEINMEDGPQNLVSSNLKESLEECRSNLENETKSVVKGEFILKVPVPRLIHRNMQDSKFGSSKDQILKCGISEQCLSKASKNIHNLDLHSTQNSADLNVKDYCSSQIPISASASSSSKALEFSPSSYSLLSKQLNAAEWYRSDKENANRSLPPVSDYGLPFPTFFSNSPSASKCKTDDLVAERKSNTAVTLVPIENVGQVCQEIEDAEDQSSISSDEAKIDAKLIEKDGLVMINKNLALRIMSTNSDDDDESSDVSHICSDKKLSCHKYSGLTIFPQSKSNNYEFGSTPKAFDGSIPDILTIVPQTNHSKPRVGSISAELTTAAGKVTPDSSHIVKLVLLPTKDGQRKSLEKEEFDRKQSKLDTSYSKSALSDMLRGFTNLHSNYDYESDEESEEGGMVIDVKEEAEESSMDPLTMCAVTMEDDISNFISPTVETNDCSTTLLEGETNNNNKAVNDISKRTLVKVDEEKYRRRKYVCQYCQKRFGWSTDLKRHVILHTGERPFKCKWCPITFTRKFLLQNHMKKLHSQVCKWSDLWE